MSSAEADELLAWVTLAHTPKLGRESIRRLLAALGSPRAVLSAGPVIWRELVGSAGASALQFSMKEAQVRGHSTMEWLNAAPDQRHIIPLSDPHYPNSLLESSDPPVLLYGIGERELLLRPCVAIIGSRNASPLGLELAREFSKEMAEQGLCIVSGLALGIDGAAHNGALEAQGGGSTIAVVGTGLDRVYPRQHHTLARQIAQTGLLLSEFPLGSPPRAEHFPMRNRIIAGVAAGTLVVEAAPKSGSLITARLALENGREVFAIPGSVRSEQARGCHQLIKDGACLVECAQDVVEALPTHVKEALSKVARQQETSPIAEARCHVPETTGSPSLPLHTASNTLRRIESAGEGILVERSDRTVLLENMGFDPVTVDVLCVRTGWSPDKLLIALLELELQGKIARLPGGLLQRSGSA